MAFEKYNSQRFIYLADDDSDDREFFADAMGEIDPDVILRQAPDGMHLMDDLLELSNSELPEFIFLDINMPGKTGLECLAEIRSSEGILKEVNIVMLSTSSDPENIRRASELGATFYAVKPSCFEKLKSLLEEVLSMNLVGTIGEKKKFLLV
jgi:CheY-like chemotaxis protein